MVTGKKQKKSTAFALPSVHHLAPLSFVIKSDVIIFLIQNQRLHFHVFIAKSIQIIVITWLMYLAVNQLIHILLILAFTTFLYSQLFKDLH